MRTFREAHVAPVRWLSIATIIAVRIVDMRMLRQRSYLTSSNEKEDTMTMLKSENREEVVLPLSQLKNGSLAEVLRFDMTDRSTLRKLLSLGIVPGTKIRVVHTFPSYVIEFDSSQIVFDKTIASSIRVRLLDNASLEGAST